MKHLKSISECRLPVLASSDNVCGRYTPTGMIKCVPRDSPKAAKIEDVPVP